jgi:hypothetical protein
MQRRTGRAGEDQIVLTGPGVVIEVRLETGDNHLGDGHNAAAGQRLRFAEQMTAAYKLGQRLLNVPRSTRAR